MVQVEIVRELLLDARNNLHLTGEVLFEAMIGCVRCVLRVVLLVVVLVLIIVIILNRHHPALDGGGAPVEPFQSQHANATRFCSRLDFAMFEELSVDLWSHHKAGGWRKTKVRL